MAALNAQYWTDFADGAVVFPIGIALALALVLLRQRRAALAWTAAIGTVWAAMLALKLIGYTVAAVIPASPLNEVDLVTPSGHVASASVIFGSLIGLLLPRPGNLIWRTVAASLAVAVGIGITRVELGDHSVSEAVIGALVGTAGAAWLASSARVPVDSRARFPLMLLTGLMLVTLHGTHFSWEHSIRRVALHAVETWRTPA